MFSSDTKYFVKLYLSKNALAKLILGHALLAISTLCLWLKKYYAFSKTLGKYEKLYEQDIGSGKPHRLHQKLIQARQSLVTPHKNNAIYESFLASKKALSIKTLYASFSQQDAVRIRYSNEDDPHREGNLLILQASQQVEDGSIQKGVLYLQYNNSLYEFVQLYNLQELYTHYTLIFEPSSWGYSDLSLELLLHGEHKVFIMAQDQIDYDIVQRIDSRLIPIRAGAGDWIDLNRLDTVSQPTEKKFDVCMVASWRKLKNHKLLFQELSQLGKGLRIALVGYSWENRTAASIRKEQKKYYPDSLVSIFEFVPHNYVFKVLADSKLALMLSEREGANRGIYEAAASNIPVVMLNSNRGVNRELITEGCVFAVESNQVGMTVKSILSEAQALPVRERLLKVSGIQNTWNKISLKLVENGLAALPHTPTIQSTPNLKYRQVEIKSDMDTTYNTLINVLRTKKNAG